MAAFMYMHFQLTSMHTPSLCISSRVYTVFADPADTVKARLQMQGALDAAPMYRSTGHAFASLARAEGVPGFYRGFGAILLGFAPAQVLLQMRFTATMILQHTVLRD